MLIKNSANDIFYYRTETDKRIILEMSKDKNIKRSIETHLYQATFQGIVKAVNDLFDSLNDSGIYANYVFDKSNQIKVAYIYEYFHLMLLKNNVGVGYDYLRDEIAMLKNTMIFEY